VSMTAQTDASADLAEPGPGSSSRLKVVLWGVIAFALVVAAVAVGHVWGSHGSSTSTPSATSVDAGFASDMSTHHQQAVTMASYARDHSDSADIRTLAYDIESSQTFQMGQMQGWLDDWGLIRNSNTGMAWMGGQAHVGADGLMPGMATPAQLNTLLASHGKALDVLFLQLMIHHHQGGVQMAHYAALHASQPYVRDLAQSMYVAQSGEIVQMESMLRQLGGTPLPPPA